MTSNNVLDNIKKHGGVGIALPAGDPIPAELLGKVPSTGTDRLLSQILEELKQLNTSMQRIRPDGY